MFACMRLNFILAMKMITNPSSKYDFTYNFYFILISGFFFFLVIMIF